MESHRGHLGGALLTLTGACWIGTVSGVAAHAFNWGSPYALGLLIAGFLCLLGSLWAFGFWKATQAWISSSPLRRLTLPHPIRRHKAIADANKLATQLDAIADDVATLQGERALKRTKLTENDWADFDRDTAELYAKGLRDRALVLFNRAVAFDAITAAERDKVMHPLSLNRDSALPTLLRGIATNVRNRTQSSRFGR
jgi:hypothetical protein